MIVDQAVYEGGRRRVDPEHVPGIRSRVRGELVWLGMREATTEEFDVVAREFDLHPLAVEDAVHAHQRPKLERYGDMLFLVLRPARYIDETETVEFGEVHVFAGPDYVITSRRGEASDLRRVRRGLESHPEVLCRGPFPVVHALLDCVVDDYKPVVAGIEHDIDEIENEVFGGDADVSRRIYELTREVIEFQRATAPLVAILETLMREPGVDDEERRYLRDVHDHAVRVHEQVDGFRALLQNILSVNLTIQTKVLSEIGIAQNDEVKKISAWAAILFAPTLVAAIYGMNFEHMPELAWRLGYPMALMMMVLVALVLHRMFKRRDWI